MLYNYVCSDCLTTLEAALDRELTFDEFQEAIFETSHAMEPTPEELAEARICPRCDGSNTKITTVGVAPVMMVRGQCLKDRKGRLRDMNLYKLVTDDPYGQYRVSGEVEDIKARLKREGQHNPNTRTFAPQLPASEPTQPPTQ